MSGTRIGEHHEEKSLSDGRHRRCGDARLGAPERHHLIGFVGVVVGHFRHLQDLGQNILPLFRAADRSRPNLGGRFKFGVETFGECTNREPSIGLHYLELMRSSTVVLSGVDRPCRGAWSASIRQAL